MDKNLNTNRKTAWRDFTTQPPALRRFETIDIDLINEPARLFPIWVSLSHIHASTCPVPKAKAGNLPGELTR